jgi:hypothetical protein
MASWFASDRCPANTLPPLLLDANLNLEVYTPRVAGCQMNLRLCSPARNGRSSAKIKAIGPCGLTPAQAPADRCRRKKISLGDAPRRTQRKISVAVMAQLMAPARGFATVAPLHQNHCRNDHDRCHHKTEWLQHKPQPMKHEDITQPYGNGRQNDDEKRAIHGNRVQSGCGLSLRPPILGPVGR